MFNELQQIQEMQNNIEGLTAGLFVLGGFALIGIAVIAVLLFGKGGELETLKDRLVALEERRGGAPITETPPAGDIGEQAIIAIRQERRQVETFKRQMGQMTPDEERFLERQLERRINAIKADFDATIDNREVI